jgi:hypothetical protein
MNRLHTSLLILLSSQLLMATEITTQTKKIEDKFCKPYKNKDSEGTFCMTNESIYPLVTSSDKGLEKYLNSSIKKILDKGEKYEVKKYVLENIKDGVYSSLGHENHLIIKILSTTTKTFSLEVNSYSYLGGAHGSSFTELINYDRATGKRLKLNDLFVKNYQEKLIKIIEKEYRRQEHVTAKDSLSDKLYWFKNKFILAENIGIGEDGLILEYNPYEIKPYAGGTTTLIVRYELLKDIIKPNSYLSSLLKEPKLPIGNSVEYTFFDKLLTFTVKLKRLTKSKIELNLMAKNHEYDISKGGVSLSFPQLKKKIDILSKSNRDFSKLLLYPEKSPIYNFKRKKNQKSDYLMVEGEAKRWKENGKKSIKMILKIDKDSKTFKVNIRATLIKDKKILPIPFEGQQGQQGTGNYMIDVKL